MSSPNVWRMAAAAIAVAAFALALPGAVPGTDAETKSRDAAARAPAVSRTAGDALGADGVHAFGPIVLVSETDVGGEPGVDVAPDGAFYVNGPSGLGTAGGSFAYRSEDGGASWSRCAATTGPGGGDSNVAIGPNGHVAMNDLWLGSLTFYLSKDRCATWLPNPVTTPVPVGDRQWVDYGHAECEYYQSWSQIPTGIHVQLSRDCGLTWIDRAATPGMDLIGNLVVDHSGRTRNAYQFYSDGGAIKVAIGTVTETLAGPEMTFAIHVVAPGVRQHGTAESFPAGAVDAAGNVHVVWHDLYRVSGQGRNAVYDSRIVYAHSTDAGVTWSPSRVISTGGSNVFPWIDAGAAGKTNAVWYHSDRAGNPNNVDGPWYVQISQATALGGAWTESRATPLSIHNDVICTGGTSCSGDDRDLLDFFEVAHDASGLAVIAFTKDTAADGSGNGEPRNAFVRQTGGPTIA